jgi:hypothetical protein
MDYLIKRFSPTQILIMFVVILLFSPYIFPRIRIDHLFLLFFLFYFFIKGQFFRSPGIYLLLFYFFGFLVTLFRIIVFDDIFTRWSPFFEYLEWLLRGFLIYEFVRYLYKDFSTLENIYSVIRAWIISCIFIGCVGILQILPWTADPINNFLGKYYINPNFLEAILNQSRITSFTGQPGSYGQIFLCSLIFLLFLGRELFTSTGKYLLTLVGVFLLSFLSLSKNILIGAPILFAIFLMLNTFRFAFIKKILFYMPFLICILYIVYLSNVLVIFDQFITPILNDRLLYAYEVIKAGSVLIFSFVDLFDSTIGVRYFESQSADITVLLDNFLFGVGFTEHNLRLSDSGYTPFLLVGGITGFVFLILYFSAITINSLHRLIYLNYIENTRYNKLFLAYITIIFLFSLIAIGQQTFTLDKSGDLFFILSALILQLRK